jgi:hypothetical protein
VAVVERDAIARRNELIDVLGSQRSIDVAQGRRVGWPLLDGGIDQLTQAAAHLPQPAQHVLAEGGVFGRPRQQFIQRGAVQQVVRL